LSLKLFNTLSGKPESFKPLDDKTVRIYSCGPTVYDAPHIGNFRAFLFFDLVKRYLRFLGYEVKHVMNITDIDDKIIARCGEEGKTLSELTNEYRAAFEKDAVSLRIDLPDTMPAATDHIDDMIDLIKQLIDKDYAYLTDDGSVFFKIGSFPNYGRLSNIDTSQLSSTERVTDDEYGKENPQDFSLWKAWKEEDGEVEWESPWGRGRPGWHIECSAMSMKYLGEEFDIHCGGVDLIFPHHENEIAQSVCATDKLFVNFWLHCEHLLVNGAKMSKSLQNYYTITDLINRGYTASAIRYLLTASHYRHKVDLTEEHLLAASQAVNRFQDFRRRLEKLATSSSGHEADLPVLDEFRKAMNNDLNIAEAMGKVFDWIREVNRKIDSNDLTTEEAGRFIEVLDKIDSVIAVVSDDKPEITDEEATMIDEREKARQEKNWSRADEIRDYFRSRGFELEDTPDGTILKLSKEGSDKL
tara:strand:- start:676 stop:2085 length:1410 start_codon:yes stop_codon:yes gene_type:complete